MRIAYICADPGIPVFGCKGCSLHVQEMIRSFLNLGIEVTLFATNQGGQAPADLQQVKCITLPPRSMTTKKLDRAQREQYAMQSHNWFMTKLLQEQAFDLVYERYSLWSLTGVEYANQQGIPSILEVNSPLIEEAKNYRGLVNKNQALTIAQHNFRNASLICCVSQAVADYVIKLVACQVGTNSKLAVIVTPNAVNPQRFSSLSPVSTRAGTDKLIIGFVGTLKPWHGLEYLLQAFAVFSQHNPKLNASLLIVGDGPQRTAIKDLANKLHITSKIQLVGAVAPADIPLWLEKMNIAVAPYPALKNFYFSPLKVFEYMAAGLPVIASDIGQIKELIQHEKQGLLVTPGSVTALTQALQQLTDHPQQASQLGYQAQQHVLQNYNWDAIAQRVLKEVFTTGKHYHPSRSAAGAVQANATP